MKTQKTDQLSVPLSIVFVVAFLMPFMAPVTHGQAVTPFFSFPSDGGGPQGGMAQGTDGSLYGATQFGGLADLGTLFKISASGSFATLYSFQWGGGWGPDGGLITGTDGYIYGATEAGGVSDDGTIFRLTVSGSLTTLYSFSALTAGTNGGFGTNSDGAYPFGVVQGTNGDFYGIALYGGVNGYGTVFEITSSGSFTTLYSFTASDGRPACALATGGDGNLYGIDGDSVFRITPGGMMEPLLGLSAGECGIIGGTDGNLYATVFGDAANPNGAVYQITPSGTPTTLYSFTGAGDGGGPTGAVTQGTDGNFYGTTQYGGANGYGTIFQITPSGSLTTLYSFTGGNDGQLPNGWLVQGTNGDFYGTAHSAGTNGYGTLFQITSNGSMSILHSFSADPRPNPGLVQGSDGSFYGTTFEGDVYSFGTGTVFKITTSGSLTTLYSFIGSESTGQPYPRGGLLKATDGNLYGTTGEGGAGNGSIFQIGASGSLTTIYSFPFYAQPNGGLVQGTDSNFYGTTFGDGYSGETVYRITFSGSLTTLYSFTGGNDGSQPNGWLVQGTDGNFYGTTASGGANDDGTVFRITCSGSLTTIYSFSPLTGGSNGAWPTNGDGSEPQPIIQASNGNYYGMTQTGGPRRPRHGV